jgi:ribose 5-phosphate isomerase B
MLIIGSDHAGFALKEFLKSHLNNPQDVGCFSTDSVDYPDIAASLANAWQEGALGILICGSGIGISIAANRYPFLRAALVHTPEQAALAREHNNANVLVLGARFIDEQAALACWQAFSRTPFAGGRHEKRVAKLAHLE